MERTTELPAVDERPAKPLTPRQAAFVREYLIDLNGTQAAIRAGYSPATANEQASRLLADANIAAHVEIGKAQRNSRINMTADSVIEELAALANSRIEHYVMDDKGQLTLAEGAPANAMAAVKSIKRKTRLTKDGGIEYEVSFELWDKPGQLKLMGKHAGVKACFDRVEVTGANGGPLEIAAARLESLPPEQLRDYVAKLAENVDAS